MTLEELKAKIHTEFSLDKMPDYMKGADLFLFLLAKPLWAIEYGREKEMFREVAFEMVMNLPTSRFFNTQGGRYMELYAHALAASNRPLTAFLKRATEHAKQQAGMLNLNAYAEMIGVEK